MVNVLYFECVCNLYIFFDFILLVLFMLFENILILFIDKDLYYDVFVINFVLNVLFDFNKCKMIFVY